VAEVLLNRQDQLRHASEDPATNAPHRQVAEQQRRLVGAAQPGADAHVVRVVERQAFVPEKC